MQSKSCVVSYKGKQLIAVQMLVGRFTTDTIPASQYKPLGLTAGTAVRINDFLKMATCSINPIVGVSKLVFVH
jgi:hypothetical protein